MEDRPTTISELRVAADPGAWHEAGFEVAAGASTIGSTRIAFAPPDSGLGIVDWELADAAGGDWDGLPTRKAAGLVVRPGRVEHPNSALRIDHVVVFTPSLERTIEAFETNGVRCRRVREVGPPEQQLRQAFFRFGEVICEVVQVPEDQAGPGGEARFWGLTITLADLEGAVADLGDRCGAIRDAVQPGRRIATIRREACLGPPVALISPDSPA